MIQWLTRARKRGCPLLAISTPEPIGTVLQIAQYACDQAIHAWSWDCASGLQALTQSADAYGCEEHTSNPDQMLAWARSIPQDGLIVAQWHGEYWQDALVRQGIMNLRNPYKAHGRSLVLIGRQLRIPGILHSDFLTHEDTLPDTDKFIGIIADLEASTGINTVKEDRERAVDALRGMTQFEAEQQFAMAATKEGIDIAQLWQAKVRLINDTPGLTYWEGSETRANVVGLEGIMQYLEAEAQGRLPVSLVIWADEAEDTFAGSEGDTSGISQDYLGRIAGHMVDTEARGLILFGHSGTGKSHTAKAAGSIFQCPVLAFDMGAMKGSLVGESESNLRHALAIERAIVGNRKGTTLWLWTTNNPEKIPPKIRSRSQPEWFYDLPGEQEQLPIWALYMAQYELEKQTFPDFDGWTGREIKQCCFEAWNKRQSLVQAARYVVPSSTSQASAIAARRKQASGRYLDASKGGVYRLMESTQERKVQL